MVIASRKANRLGKDQLLVYVGGLLGCSELQE